MNKIVIIGGGLAGLSAGFHLPEHAPVLFEKDSEVGGLCRSFEQDGFTFDCTGHLLHLKNAYTRELVDRILPDAFRPHERQAAIYSKSVLTPYPFQANTFGLPPQVVKECVMGFIDTLNVPRNGNHANFHDWVLTTFGAGIAKHFMLPYNEKFWKMDLADVTSEWVSWSIPKPTIEEVVNGALGLTNTGMGYNPKFIYPRRGGIDCIPQALSRGISRIHKDHALESIDPGKKFVRFKNGREEAFDRLITTIPLPLTFELLTDAPDELRAAAKKLRAISVLNFNIGVDRPNISNKHWVYYPENEYIFSRIGFPSNFSDTLSPPNTSSIYIEITYGRGQRPNVEAAYEQAIIDLHKCGILQKGDGILTRNMIDIQTAYIIFDQNRLESIEKLIGYLASRDIYTAGRYGKWDYYSMEDSILSGKAAAEMAAGSAAN
jgi:protoporphyrinogen oxidase